MTNANLSSRAALTVDNSVLESIKTFSGISRISRIESLDGFNYPFFQAFRPLSKSEITTVGGKGLTSEESLMSVIMEAAEYQAAETLNYDFIGKHNEVCRDYNIIDIDSLCCQPDVKNEVFYWSTITDYFTQKNYAAPYSLVGLNDMGDSPVLPNTNGLASGFTLDESILHGFFEVLERHAYSLSLFNLDAYSIELASVNDLTIARIIEQIHNNNLIVETKDISKAVGLPCFYTVIFGKNEADTALINGGFGCHIDKSIAIKRSLLEAIQSRLVVIAGAREDIQRVERIQGEGFDATSSPFSFWYTKTQRTVDFNTYHSSIDTNLTIAEMIRYVYEKVKCATPSIGNLLYKRINTPVPELFVTKVVLEGAESYGFTMDRMGRLLFDVSNQIQ